MSSHVSDFLKIARAAYVHVPFCVHRCGYCDFTVIAGRDDLISRYLAGLRRELESSLAGPVEVDTLFIGGGTPSLLTASQLEELFSLLTEWLPVAAGGEFSIECNPDRLTPDRMAVMAKAGVNRVSLGVQSFHTAHLQVLERQHTADDVQRVVHDLRDHDLENISLDLIYAVPGQTLDDWTDSLQAALALHPRHLSTYGLTYEKGTAFWTRRQRGLLTSVADETEREMYARAMDVPASHGLCQYELSNHALPGYACRHNMTYWRGEAYLGFGPGAASFLDGVRRVNHRSVTGWLQRVEHGQSPVQESETLDEDLRAREAVMLGLRQIAGINIAEFQQRYGQAPGDLNPEALSRFLSLGWLEQADGALRLTREGRFMADTVAAEFL